MVSSFWFRVEDLRLQGSGGRVEDLQGGVKHAPLAIRILDLSLEGRVELITDLRQHLERRVARFREQKRVREQFRDPGCVD